MATPPIKSCMRCTSYLTCTDKQKNTRGHYCIKFKRLKEIEDVSDLGSVLLAPEHEDDAPVKKPPKKRSAPDSKGASAFGVSADEPEFDIEVHEEMPDNFILDAMQRAYDPHTNTVRDLRVDDTQLKLAKNYYDYCANLSGTRIKMPFARQLWICLMLMGEMCPKCTHPKAQDMFNIPVDLDPHKLARSMTLLEYGVCPKCGSTRHSLIQAGLLNDYYELVFVAGQRCVTGDTRVLTSDGMLTFDQLAERHAASYVDSQHGFVSYHGPKLVNDNGDLLKPSHFYRSKKGKVLEITLSTGQRLKGTPDHPILLSDGTWRKLGHMDVGCEVYVPHGQRIFSNKTVSIAGVVLTPMLSGYLGYVTSEGHSYYDENSNRVTSVNVSNNDADVLDYCRAALSKSFASYEPSVGRRPTVVRVFKREITAVLDKFMGGQLSQERLSAQRFIPQSVLSSPMDVVQEYMRCLFEGDGYASKHGVSYTSISKRLAEDVQQVLLNFGIPCAITHKDKIATNGSASQVPVTAYSVVISGHKALSNFQHYIGFKSTRKNLRLSKRVAHLAGQKLSSVAWYDKLSDHDVVAVDAWFRGVDTGFVNSKHSQFFDTLERPRTYTVRGLTGVRWRYGKVGRTWLKSSIQTVLDCDRVKMSMTKELHAEALRLIDLCDEQAGYAYVTSVVQVDAAVTYDVHIPKHHRFMANGLLNHNSGKSTVAATLVTYMLHRYLKSPKLSSLAAGIQDFTPLTMSFVALTATKALKLLWVPIRDMIGASQWFEDYFALLDRIGRETGRELYQFKPNGTYCRVFHKSLELLPDGPSKRNLRGATRACAVTDELGWFPYNPKPDEDADQAEERERANADEVYTALDNSLATVRTAVPALYAKGVFTYPQAMNLNLSSPASWKDKIMRLWKESQDSKLALGVKAATWDISPMYTRDHPFIVDKFNRNARNAARDFGAEPPALSSTIFDRDILAKLFNQKMWYRPSYENHVDKTVANLVAEFEPQQLPPAVLSLDAGVVNNSFALTLLFKTGDTYVTPLVLEVIPEDGKPINFPRMYAQVIKPIIQSCNVRLVVSDRWNSIYVLDQIREDFPNKVITRQITLKTADFKEFRALVASGQLLMPELELGIGQIETATDYRTAFKRYAASHLFSQFLTIQEIAGMFYKGEGSTDDILRSLIVASTALLDAKLSEYMRSCQTIDRSATSTQAVVLVGSRYGAMSVLGWNRY